MKRDALLWGAGLSARPYQQRLASPFVYTLFTTFLCILAYVCGVHYIESKLPYQTFEVIKMWTRWSMIVVSRNARRKVHDDLIFVHTFTLSDLPNKIAQFTVGGASTATSASDLKCAIRSILWICNKTACTFMKCFLAIVP